MNIAQETTGKILRPRGVQFSLAGALLTMAALSLCFAWMRVEVTTGLMALFVTALSLIRTWLISRREADRHGSFSTRGRLIEFCFSVAIMIPVMFAAIAVGSITSAGSATISLILLSSIGWNPDSWLVVAALIASLLAGIATGIFMLAAGIHSSLHYVPVEEAFRKR